MQQDEVIMEALRNAPPSAAPVEPPAEEGEKVIEAESLGDVDESVVTHWIESNGGRTEEVDDATVWVIGEDAIEL
ncbi:MAG: hypothetical protein Q7T55_02610 [Solirubrobacteraceae bacterium]|nr:hypothetical protein [Solirubrobacteraceae bacterium]